MRTKLPQLELLDSAPLEPGVSIGVDAVESHGLSAQAAELAEDIRQRGIPQPIVVHPVDEAGLFRIHFGAKRFRAAARAGLSDVRVDLGETNAVVARRLGMDLTTVAHHLALLDLPPLP